MTKSNVSPAERTPLLKQVIRDKTATLVSLDTETSLIPALVWSTGEQYISEKNLQGETKLIMAQYLFEGDKKAKLVTWDKKQNDQVIIKDLAKHVFNKPNLIVVGQNQKAFDLKIINDRACKHNEQGIAFNTFIQVDILQLSRSSFRRASHSLDSRSKRYGFGGKLPMEFGDWVDIHNGNAAALSKMAKYGLKDPADTLKTFWRELPYYKALPADLERLLRAKKIENTNKFICLSCKKQRQTSTNTTILKSKKGIATLIGCNRCNHAFEVN
jgi:DNA polymerase elongation subunit (family B)